MQAQLFFRVASGLMVLLAAGHSVGTFRPVSPTPEVKAVREGMNSVTFKTGPFVRTVGRFYFGFSLLMSIWIIASAVLSWQLGDIAGDSPAIAHRLGMPFFVSQVALAVVSWTCLNLPPAVASTLAAACIGIATMQL